MDVCHQKKAQIHEVLPFLSTNKENVVTVTLLLFFVVKSIFVRLIFIVGFFFFKEVKDYIWGEELFMK